MAIIVILFLCTMLYSWQSSKLEVESYLAILKQARAPRHDRFTPDMVASLPTLVQRYFYFTIKPGARLYSSAEFDMTGAFSFGPGKADRTLIAHQLHCPPLGMIWKAIIGNGFAAMAGSDGVLDEKSWTLFSLFDLFPIARVGGNDNHYRSAVARMLAEAVFWTPGALLVSLPVVWESNADDVIQATLESRGIKTVVSIRLREDGCPTEVSFQRWSDANPNKEYQYQPFGGYLSCFEEFEGINVPTHVEAGNFFGTEDYFAFYKIDVQNFQWLS